ncbi:hypothetical protein QOZ80_7BG0584730 [Eleusine coracana subsp. coracana]|nr:hypothetical protein QOZ80_7BG0584730 [Eleusine coracana subsp. coracana]
MEELVEEYLLRIPPDDPATLVRAALVCKPWCRIVSAPRFRRRFRELHRTPPMLGLCYVTDDNPKGKNVARFVPTTSFSPPRGIRRNWHALDSRHGRVLLHHVNWNYGPFVIWDPISDEKQELPILPRLLHRDVVTWSAAVVCAAAGTCDHLDCQPGAFRVVAACTSIVEMFVYIYSSEIDAWSMVSASNPGGLLLEGAPGALVGNVLYFACFFSTKILMCDLGMREITFIDGPSPCPDAYGHSVLMTTEDGRLGMAHVLNFKLYISSSEVGPNGDAIWSPSRIIELATLPPFSTLTRSPLALGAVDGVGIIFLRSLDGLFTIDIKSGHLRKCFEDRNISHYVIPFMSFYNPALGMASAGEESNVGTSNT